MPKSESSQRPFKILTALIVGTATGLPLALLEHVGYYITRMYLDLKNSV